MSKADLFEMYKEPIKVHNDGFVRVVDVMGDDFSVVQMARTSYGKGTKTVQADKALIRYLMRNRHTSPFEGAEIKLHIRCPIFVARQWLRHRTASVNEVSARYTEMEESFYIPDEDYIRAQSSNNKQCSGNVVDSQDAEIYLSYLKEIQKSVYNVYKYALSVGISRERARELLPVGLYTEFYWKIDLHNLLHFLELRMHPHAQQEIRDYANIIGYEIVKTWVPITWQAFLDYRLNAVTFSKQAFDALNEMFTYQDVMNFIDLLKNKGVSDRELNEYKKMFGL